MVATQHAQEYVPLRGDVVWIDLEPQIGNEIRERRPALVLSAFTFNHYQNLAVICPITNTVRTSRYDIEVPEGYTVQGFIRVDQVKCLDWRAREAELEKGMPKGMPDEIVDAVSTIVEKIIWAVW